MNHLEGRKLHNTYYSFRHGRSEGNRDGLLYSDESYATLLYGLTDEGRQDVWRAAQDIQESGIFEGKEVVIVTSDILRAEETAHLLAHSIRVTHFLIDPRLRERRFGMYDRQSDTNLHTIWERDKQNIDQMRQGVESMASVQDRTTELVVDLETIFSNCHIIFISHGDTLQGAETGFKNMPPNDHRDLEPLDNATLRRLS